MEKSITLDTTLFTSFPPFSKALVHSRENLRAVIFIFIIQIQSLPRSVLCASERYGRVHEGEEGRQVGADRIGIREGEDRMGAMRIIPTLRPPAAAEAR